MGVEHCANPKVLLGHRSRALTLDTHNRVIASTNGGTASAMEDTIRYFSPALV